MNYNYVWFFIFVCIRNQYQSTWQLGVSDHGQACRLQFYFSGWQHPTDEMALSGRLVHDDYQSTLLYLRCWCDYLFYCKIIYLGWIWTDIMKHVNLLAHMPTCSEMNSLVVATFSSIFQALNHTRISVSTPPTLCSVVQQHQLTN